ncbi:MAG: DUF4340 domain-containing protein [Planctomycetota bacterium]
MKLKSLLLLGGVTAVIVLLAISQSGDGTTKAGEAETGQLLPDLSASLNDIATIAVTGGGSTTTLERGGESWACAEISGYPADFDKVRDLLVTMTQLDIVETMTKRAERHTELGLDEEGGTHVTLAKAGGEEVAALVLGNTKYARSGQRIYVRRRGQDQTYLCEGDLAVTGDPMTWVNKEIVRIESARPNAVEVRHADGEVLALSKLFPAAPNWDVAGVPDDRVLSGEAAGNQIGTALSYLAFDEVQPADSLALADNEIGVTTFQTFDGLFVDVRSARIEDKTWVTLNARFEAPPDVMGPAPEDPEAEPESTPSVDPERQEQVRQEAEALNARLAGWAYQVPQYKADVLLKRMNDLLAELPEEAPIPALEGDAGAQPGAVEVDIPAEFPSIQELPPAEEPAEPASDPSEGGGR